MTISTSLTTSTSFFIFSLLRILYYIYIRLCSDYNDSTETKQSIHVTPEMCYHCFDILIYHWFHPTNELISSSSSPPMEFISTIPTSIVIPLFVTWEIKGTTSSNNNNNNNHHHHPSYRLRGCIGTFQCQTTVSMALGEYAKLAAFKDQRFDPISRLELHSLRVSVSLLVNMESCIDCYDWDIGIHGIQIRLVPKNHDMDTMIHDNLETTLFSATYLPDVAKQQGYVIVVYIYMYLRTNHS
jgi:AMMECR1 domain-containing protein